MKIPLYLSNSQARPGPPEDLIDAEQIIPQESSPNLFASAPTAEDQECRPLDLCIPVLGAGTGQITGESRVTKVN